MKIFFFTISIMFFSVATSFGQQSVLIDFDNKGKEYIEAVSAVQFEAGKTKQGLVVREGIIVNLSDIISNFTHFEVQFWVKSKADETMGIVNFLTTDDKGFEVEMRKGQLRLIKGNSIFPIGSTNDKGKWQAVKLSVELLEDLGKWNIKLASGQFSKEIYISSNKRPSQLLIGRSDEEFLDGIVDEISIKEIIKEEPEVTQKEEPAIIVKTGCKNISLAMWDDGEIDKDMVNLDLNGKTLESFITLKKKPYVVNFIPEEGSNELRVSCVSAGELSTNTVSVLLSCAELKGEPFQLSMEEGDFKSFVINHDPNLPAAFGDATNDPPMGKTKYLDPITLKTNNTFLKYRTDRVSDLTVNVGKEKLPLNLTTKETQKPFHLKVGKHQIVINTTELTEEPNNLFLKIRDDFDIVGFYTLPLGEKVTYVIPINQLKVEGRKAATIIEKTVQIRKVKFEIFDFQDEDGDSIAILIDGVEDRRIMLTKAIQTLSLTVPEKGKTIVSFVNLGEGKIPSNTLRVRLYQGQNKEILNLATNGVNRESRIILKYGFFVRDE